MGFLDDIKQKVAQEQQDRDSAVNASLAPGDDTTPANNFRNSMIGALGLSDSYKNSVGDEARLAARPQPVGANAFLSTAMGGPAEEAQVLQMGPALMESAAMKAYPEFAQHAGLMVRNPKAPIVMDGAVNSKFQKLRDFLGHTGPVIFKGK